MNRISTADRSRVIACLVEGNSIRSTVRITGNTNHFGETWSWGRVNVCPACPPFKKYPEFGGHTLWKCLDTEPEIVKQP